MIFYLIFLIIFGIIDMIILIQRKEKKEIITYITLMGIALVYGIYYFNNEYSESLYINLLNLFNIRM